MNDPARRLVEIRAATHGDFNAAAVVMDDMLNVWMDSPNWAKMTPGQRIALYGIAHKVSRILTGNPDHSDHWDDVAGYAHCGKNGSGLAREDK